MHIFHHFKSIRYKYLFVTLLLMIVFILSTSYLWYIKTSKDAFHSASEYLSEMVRVSNESLDSTLRDINYLVSATARNTASIINILDKDISSYDYEYQRLEDDREIADYLNSAFVYKTSVKGIMIANFKNRYYSVGDMPSYDIMKKCSWYQNFPAASDGTFFTPPHTYIDSRGNLTDTDQVISVIRPIFSENKVIGFVLVDIKYSYFEKIYDLNLKGKSSILTCDMESGKIIFTSQSNKEIEFSNDELQFLKDNCQGNQGTFQGTLKGKQSIIQYQYSTLTKWTSIGIISKKQLLFDFHRTSNSIIIYQCFFLVLGIIIIYFTARIMTKNILKLSVALKELDKQKMNISVEIHSNDEIEELAVQFNAMVVRINDLLLDVQTTASEKRKADLKVLESQINPHFLYNTLNTISYLATLNGIESIKDVSNSLICLMNINMSNRQFITISSELEYLKSYLYIQEYKYNHKFEYNLTADETIQSCVIPKLLIQPLVENALIHGFSPMKGTGFLLVQFYEQNHTLNIRIQDNGIGITKETLEKLLLPNSNQDHIGLYNVKNRIQLYFGSEFGMTISSEPSLYTIIELVIPLIEESETIQYG